MRVKLSQACEFDYSGTQACRVLKREGYRGPCPGGPDTEEWIETGYPFCS